MKSDKNILIAFLLNLIFSVFEFFGGIMTNSVSIMSDAIHDLGDSLSIGVSYILEKISKKKPDNRYTYGYGRYSVIGSLITTIILIVGSIFVVVNAVDRLFNQIDINYNGMIGFAFLGVIVNFLAAYFTRKGESLNQKAVNLHMLEDVLGWVVVLIGAIVMKFTDIRVIDPVLSILVALFIFMNAVNNLIDIGNLFLEKVPDNVDLDELRKRLLGIDGVVDIHHIHVWSMDGVNNYATLHVVCEDDEENIKSLVKGELKKCKINHMTIEVESVNEKCDDECCKVNVNERHNGHHHHHH